MKYDHRLYDNSEVCHGCRQRFLIYKHLIECPSIKKEYQKEIMDIKELIKKYRLCYNEDDIFQDYGLEKLIKENRISTMK